MEPMWGSPTDKYSGFLPQRFISNKSLGLLFGDVKKPVEMHFGPKAQYKQVLQTW